VSVLDACNLRCTYCAPGTVTTPTPKPRWLSAMEHAALAPHFAAIGVRKVRFTGGEPLLREDLVDVVAAWRRALPDAELAVTTNATRLLAQASMLRAAGIDRVTVHLDTLRRERYEALMGRGSPEQVQEAVAVAVRTFDEVKLNVVDDVFMPGREVIARLGARPVPRRHASDPAALFVKDDVVFGLIASDTEPFCGACDRLRLTADGRLRGCLYESGGVPLGAAIRDGVDVMTLRRLVEDKVAAKRSFHPLTLSERVPFSMADIGG
jgi:cyclic pyranopterin phosphate synthase